MLTGDALTDLVANALEKRTANLTNLKRFRGGIQEACEVDLRTVDKWRAGEQAPAAHQLLRLFDHLGPSFANEILDVIGIVAARTDDAEHILTALALKDARKVIPALRAAANELEDKLGAVGPKAVEGAG